MARELLQYLGTVLREGTRRTNLLLAATIISSRLPSRGRHTCGAQQLIPNIIGICLLWRGAGRRRSRTRSTSTIAIGTDEHWLWHILIVKSLLVCTDVAFRVPTAGCLFTSVCSTELIPAITEVGPGTLRTAAQASCAKRTLAKTQQVFTNDKPPAKSIAHNSFVGTKPQVTPCSLNRCVRYRYLPTRSIYFRSSSSIKA